MHVIFLITLLSALLFGESNFSGMWNTNWRGDDGALMILEQNGSKVKGTYSSYDGHIIGSVKGRTLTGRWYSGDGKGPVTFTLSPDGNSFAGSFDSGEWWNGARINSNGVHDYIPYNYATPEETLKTFLTASNNTHSPIYVKLKVMVNALDYRNYPATSYYVKHQLASLFFNVIDQCYFRIFDLHYKDNTKPDIYFTINQQNSPNKIKLHFSKQEHEYKLVIPPKGILENLLHKMLAQKGLKEIDNDGYKQLQSPRDTMKAFLKGINTWNSGGKELAESTLDLSQIHHTIRNYQAPIAVEYLKNIIDRVGYVFYQEIPNDSNSENDYIYYKQSLGNITIHKVKHEDGSFQWKFAPETVAVVSAISDAMENVPQPYKYNVKKIEDTSIYFTMRNFAKSISYKLINKYLYLELWQWIVIALVFFTAYNIIGLFTNMTYQLLLVLKLDNDAHLSKINYQFMLPGKILSVGIIWHFGIIYLGAPSFIFEPIYIIGQLLILASIVWISLSTTALIQSYIAKKAEATETNWDDIIISLTASLLKIFIIIFAFIYLADIFNIPYQTIIAGLGIGGLAFAIAAKDTIANFFGSAIVLADKPFQPGDYVIIGDKQGTIVHVGLRSTTIRTHDNTELIIPNNTVTNESVENLSRRNSRRVLAYFHLSHNTPTKKIQDLVRQIETLLKNNEHVIQDKTRISISDFALTSIELEIIYYLDTALIHEFTILKHEISLDIVTLMDSLEIQRAVKIEGLDQD